VITVLILRLLLLLDAPLKNTIICLTSNLGTYLDGPTCKFYSIISGSDILAHPTACDANGVVTPEAKEEVFERVSEHFPPELLNRLDSTQVFNKLSRKSILEVVSLRLKDVADRLKNRRITLDVDDTAKAWLAEQGYSQVYGARAIARVVRTDVLFPLAQKLLRGTIRWVLLRFPLVLCGVHLAHLFSFVLGMEIVLLFVFPLIGRRLRFETTICLIPLLLFRIQKSTLRHKLRRTAGSHYLILHYPTYYLLTHCSVNVL